ncbi:MAG: DUF5658 family protein [Fuerstiella sp.]
MEFVTSRTYLPAFAGLLRTVVLSAATVASSGLLADSGVSEDTRQSGGGVAQKSLLFSDSVFDGVLYLNGTYVSPPYRIEASNDSIWINGMACDQLIDSESKPDDFHDARTGARTGARVDGRGDGRGDGRFRGEMRAEGRRNDEAAPDFERRRGWWGSNAESRRRPSWRQSSAVRLARSISESLDTDNTVIILDEAVINLNSASEFHDFADAVLAESPDAEQIANCLNLVRDASVKELWHQWLKEHDTTPDERQALQPRLETIVAAEDRNLRSIAANHRLRTFAYPLTIAGMLLGVFALGHMLKWTGRGLGAKDGDTASPESTRAAEVALLLMLGMSAIDLIWTVLAGQAGAMKELNPLAARFIHSPESLALFKVVATAIGCGILYAWRHRSQIQHATWWMCLVCVLLTFRWVMFDSMMS